MKSDKNLVPEWINWINDSIVETAACCHLLVILLPFLNKEYYSLDRYICRPLILNYSLTIAFMSSLGLQRGGKILVNFQKLSKKKILESKKKKNPRKLLKKILESYKKNPRKLLKKILECYKTNPRKLQNKS